MTDDEKYMRMAINEARLSKSEDSRPHPKVGAVVVQDGEFLAKAHRGELASGDHAEFTALHKKLEKAKLSGCTVYTTLEPCTTRHHPKLPCAQRLAARNVKRVVVGMLDPNPNILGQGVLQLRAAGMVVDFFPHELMAELEELNRDFRAAHPALTPITPELIRTLEERSLNQWYSALNKTFWSRNYQRSRGEVFSHLVEVVGSLSALVSGKNKGQLTVYSYMAKALAWWCALCGKAGIRDVEVMLWGKYPAHCPYCRKARCLGRDCARKKRPGMGPDWTALGALGAAKPKPKTVGGWQRMFGTIYPVGYGEKEGYPFAKLVEEIGELSEAVRVFSEAPGYFLSEASDVFGWLMKLMNVVEDDVEPSDRGKALENALADLYPGRCRDCHRAVCSCAPILGSTIGRIAHEVPKDLEAYPTMFMTAEERSSTFRVGGER